MFYLKLRRANDIDRYNETFSRLSRTSLEHGIMAPGMAKGKLRMIGAQLEGNP